MGVADGADAAALALAGSAALRQRQRELAAALAAGAQLAAERVYAYGVRVTPLEETHALPPRPGLRAWLKLDSEQVTGSFKARGAVNTLAALPAERRAQGVVAASTGNHARAVAHALATVPGYTAAGARNAIWLPSTVAPVKLEALQRTGAPTHVSAAADCAVVEREARAHAAATGAEYVSPYNNLLVAAGQGTAGLEIAAQLRAALAATAPSSAPLPPLVLVVPVGGGGLISGVAAALKAAWAGSRCAVVGAQPASNACMAASVAAGRLLGDDEFDDGATWSDGTAGGIEAGAFTFDACARAATKRADVLARLAALRRDASADADADADAPLVDALWCVSEDALRRGMRAALDVHHKIVEGAAGAAIAAAAELADAGALDGCAVVVFVCGCNVATSRIKELLAD
jgi:threonine dehydratase